MMFQFFFFTNDANDQYQYTVHPSVHGHGNLARWPDNHWRLRAAAAVQHTKKKHEHDEKGFDRPIDLPHDRES